MTPTSELYEWTAWHAHAYGGQVSMRISNVSVRNVFLVRKIQKILQNFNFQYGIFPQVNGTEFTSTMQHPYMVR